MLEADIKDISNVFDGNENISIYFYWENICKLANVAKSTKEQKQ